MADSQWLFPVLAERVVQTHDRLFLEIRPYGRRLAYKELQRYGDYPIGWRTGIEISGRVIDIDVLLSADTPFSEPRVALSDENYHLIWPHVESNGLLCLRTPADTIDHCATVDLTEYYIDEARQLIDDSSNGKTRDGFVTEFGSYWNRWGALRGGNQGSLWMLAYPAPPSRKVFSATFGGITFVSESVEEGLQWAIAFYKKNTIKTKQFKPAAFLWFEGLLTPEQYPKHNRDVANLAINCGCFDLLLDLVPNEHGSLDVVFGFKTENGSALGAVKLNEPILRNGSKGKGVYFRFKGLRPQTAKTAEGKKRYFTTSGMSEPLHVQRIDREWIFERGGKGLSPQIDQARICLIGCGSLGAQIAKNLIQSGARKLVLIDPDSLSWDNIGRHLLGADAIGVGKVTGLKNYLQRHFPGMLEIHAELKTWQHVFADEDNKHVILDSDIIISTIGSWDAEAALNFAFNSSAQFPPVVFGWTEPFGVAGHAIAITGLGGCLTCGMSPKGRFKYAVSRWQKNKNLRRAPACGDTYQPYGVADMAPIQAMITRLAVDIILGNIKISVHNAWIGPLADVEANGGTIWEGATRYYSDLGAGYRQIHREWPVCSSCSYKH